MDLEITVAGDLEVDQHHTVEDTGIVFGEVSRAKGAGLQARHFARWLFSDANG